MLCPGDGNQNPICVPSQKSVHATSEGISGRGSESECAVQVPAPRSTS
jgi:hypothetical protein